VSNTHECLAIHTRTTYTCDACGTVRVVESTTPGDYPRPDGMYHLSFGDEGMFGYASKFGDVCSGCLTRPAAELMAIVEKRRAEEKAAS
jgi:hypothetical protein